MLLAIVVAVYESFIGASYNFSINFATLQLRCSDIIGLCNGKKLKSSVVKLLRGGEFTVSKLKF